MRGLQVRLLHSTAELRLAAAVWDDLWSRSAVVHPSARAKMLAECQEHFVGDRRFFAAMVFDGADAVAALPLTAGRLGILPAGVLPGSAWAPGGELLVDRQCDALTVCRELLVGLRQSGWGILRWDEVPWHSPAWQAVAQACDDAGLPMATTPQYSVGTIDIDHDWNGYLRARSKSFRRHVRMLEQRCAGLDLTLECHEHLEPDAVSVVLNECLALEAHGWKGRAGTAIDSVCGMRDYYLRQARQLAAWQCLHLTLLRVDGQLAAFEYGWRSKGTYAILKIGFNEGLAQLSPGQLLRRLWLERVFSDRAAMRVDFVGPLSRATRQWASSQYSVSRTLAALSGPVSRGVVRAAGWRYTRRLNATVDLPVRREKPPAGSDSATDVVEHARVG